MRGFGQGATRGVLTLARVLGLCGRAEQRVHGAWRATHQPASPAVSLVHRPETHGWFAGHFVWQSPQWFSSALVSTQTSPHEERPVLQDETHWPPSQLETPPSGATHAWPQAPQLDESVITSLHAPTQFTYPVAHTAPQAPRTHVGVSRGPAKHTVPQSPQLDVSAAVSTQEPSQFVVF